MIWIGYARAGQEFAVQSDIEELGISAWVPRQINAKRVPTSRVAVPVIAPYLSNYVFIECTDDQWHLLRGIKNLSATLAPVSPRAAKAYLAPFREKIEADFTARQDAIAAGAKVMEYNPGDVLEVIGGSMAGLLVTFRKLVESDRDLNTRIAADLHLFGRVSTISLDPIQVRRADLT